MVERIRLDSDIAVMHAVLVVRRNRRVNEIYLAAADRVIPAVCIDLTADVDTARAACDRLLDVDGERHVNMAALIEPPAARMVADIDDLIIPERAVIAVEILVEQRQLGRIVCAEADVLRVRQRENIERLYAFHPSIEIHLVRLECEIARTRIDLAPRRCRQILRLQGECIAVRPDVRRPVERH